jgi:transposase
LGCHRPRISERVVFDKLVQVLVLGCAYDKIADTSCSASTIRRRRDEWIAAGVFAELDRLVLDAYDRIAGLQLDDIAVDGCIVKAPCGGQAAGRSPVDRGKQGTKRSLAVDAVGIPLGVVVAGANCHDSPLLSSTLDTVDRLGPLPEHVTVHLDRGYDSTKTRDLLASRGLHGRIAEKGKPAPVQVGKRWVVERTNSWHNRGFKKLAICTERRTTVIDAFVALANAIITLRRLVRSAWTTHRWDTRPSRRP